MACSFAESNNMQNKSETHAIDNILATEQGLYQTSPYPSRVPTKVESSWNPPLQ